MDAVIHECQHYTSLTGIETLRAISKRTPVKSVLQDGEAVSQI